MTGYDIIGDIHGCADMLHGVLRKLGYEVRDGAYRFPKTGGGRQAIFVGDLIDRGTKQVETYELVRAMVEGGSAQIVMGNHEFNAISYGTPNPEIPGEFMRPRTEKNRKQHRAFIDQVQVHRGKYAEIMEWFNTLPLWLDLVGIRVVHACWNDDEITRVRGWLPAGTPMTEDFIVRANFKGSQEHRAVEVLLKGPEISLTDYGQPAFMDKDEHVRSEARIRWWNSRATTLNELAEIPGGSRTPKGDRYPHLPHLECPEEASFDYHDAVPVFYGHYWRQWKPNRGDDWTANSACVDFSAVKGGPLVAYRWNRGEAIDAGNYVKYRHG